MKTRLNLSIDYTVLEDAKAYAAGKQTSLSDMVETYLKTLTRPAKRTSVLDVLDKLEKPKGKKPADTTDEYYRERASKYGF